MRRRRSARASKEGEGEPLAREEVARPLHDHTELLQVVLFVEASSLSSRQNAFCREDADTWSSQELLVGGAVHIQRKEVEVTQLLMTSSGRATRQRLDAPARGLRPDGIRKSGAASRPGRFCVRAGAAALW